MSGSKLFRKFVQTAFIGAAIAMAQSASAIVVTETIDFNNFSAGALGNSNRAVGTSGGFIYNGGIQGDSQSAFLFSAGNIVLRDGGEGNFSGAGGSLSRTGAALFSVLSFDIANLSGTGSGAPVQIAGGGLNGSGFRVGIDPGGFAWTTNSSSFQTIDLTAFGNQFVNLTSFVTNLVSDGNHYAIDNIVVQYNNGVTADVPEPGSIALLGLALAGLGVTRRKKAS